MKTLFWKEWRERRIILFLGLAIFLVFRLWVELPIHFYKATEDVIYLGFLWIFWVVFSALFGSEAFASERERETLPFLLSQPVSAVKTWTAKFLSGFLFSSILILWGYSLDFGTYYI